MLVHIFRVTIMKLISTLSLLLCLVLCPGMSPAQGASSDETVSSAPDKPDASTAMHGTNVKEVVCPNGVTISKFWARASTGKTSAAYMHIKGGDKGSYLTHATTPVAKTVEVHEHVSNGVTLQMRKVDDFHIPAGAEFTFQPGDKHLMLIGLTKELQDHHMVPLTLLFDDQSRCTLYVPVELRQPF